MSTNHVKPSLFLLMFCLGFSCMHMASSRVLVRPSVSTLLPYNTDFTGNQYAPKLLDRNDHQPITTNATASDQIYNDLLSFLSSKRLQRRAGKQPAPTTDAELAASAAKGCSMLYMMAANADDALTRLKTNPSLAGLTSSQSRWDNAGALKRYGWAETKDTVNWAYMGVNDVMKELGIDTASQDNVNVQLLQENAVTIDRKSYVVSEVSCADRLCSVIRLTLTTVIGIRRCVRSSHQRSRRPRDTILHLLSSPRSSSPQHQRRAGASRSILRCLVPGILKIGWPRESRHRLAQTPPVPEHREREYLVNSAEGIEEQERRQDRHSFVARHRVQSQRCRRESFAGHADRCATGVDADTAQAGFWGQECCQGMIDENAFLHVDTNWCLLFRRESSATLA
jgi:hypothetical protein